MEISLKGQIVLLDEAHNIEDSAREAASQSITQEQIQRALQDMDTLSRSFIYIYKMGIKEIICSSICVVCGYVHPCKGTVNPLFQDLSKSGGNCTMCYQVQ